MSLSTEPIYENMGAALVLAPATATPELFIKPSWLKLDAIVTALLDIENETGRYRQFIKHDMRILSLSGLAGRWEDPEFSAYREVDAVLGDMCRACR